MSAVQAETVVFVPVELPVPVGERRRDVVALGVMVVNEPPLSTETKGRAEEIVEAAEVSAGEGVVEVEDIAADEVCGATTINKRQNEDNDLCLRLSRSRKTKYPVEPL